MKLTAIIESEDDGYVSLCPELDIASQGESIEQARDNLREALELFFECASPNEVKEHLRGDVYVTQVEVATGKAARSLRQRGLCNFRAARLRRGSKTRKPHHNAKKCA